MGYVRPELAGLGDFLEVLQKHAGIVLHLEAAGSCCSNGVGTMHNYRVVEDVHYLACTVQISKLLQEEQDNMKREKNEARGNKMPRKCNTVAAVIHEIHEPKWKNNGHQ